MVKYLNFNTMVRKLNYLLVLFLCSTLFSFAQENDDMYFNKRDRVVKKVKKITPAETILSKYRSGITNTNNSDKINSDIISKYKFSVAVNNHLSKKSSKNIGSLKYDRDNLFRSKSFNKRFLDLNLYMMYGRIRPNYYFMMNPYDLSYLKFHLIYRLSYQIKHRYLYQL